MYLTEGCAELLEAPSVRPPSAEVEGPILLLYALPVVRPWALLNRSTVEMGRAWGAAATPRWGDSGAIVAVSG